MAAGARCSICGYDRDDNALHFHHRDPATKRFALSRAQLGRKWADLIAEAAKCDLLCRNCHARLEQERALAAFDALGDRPSPTAKGCRRHGLQPHFFAEGRWRCGVCRSEAVIDWYRRRKAKLIAMSGGVCEKCGVAEPQAALEFHHADPATKGFALSGPGLFRSWDEIAPELEKTVLLCGNCHAETEAGAMTSAMRGEEAARAGST